MKTEKYNGMYLGIVIQNNDPEKRGRVKVYIPHISANVYTSWYQSNVDKTFSFPGNNIDSDINKVIEPLKLVLPWSEAAMPLVGATGSGRYNSHLEHGTISDSSNVKTTKENTEIVDVDSKYNLNDTGLGESPGRKYEIESMRLGDAFTTSLSGSKNAPNTINPHSYDYKPTTYSNQAKGSYSIPNVGSHLWVFFNDGDVMSPVYFASSSGQEDWAGIYRYNEESDYPGTYENINKEDDEYFDIDTDTYRNKYVINQKGGVLEFINTDNREVLKMTHFSGSFKEFNNNVNIELASKNDQKLVIENQFLTVKGFRSTHVGRDLDSIVRGDNYTKIGNLSRSVHQQWKTVAKELHDVKMLFDIQRCQLIGEENLLPIPEEGTGGWSPCPCCSNTDLMDKIHVVNSEMKRFNKSQWPGISGGGIDQFPVRVNFKNEITDSLKSSYDGIVERHILENDFSQGETPGEIFGLTCPVCLGTGLSPSTMHGTWQVTPSKSQKEFDKLHLKMIEDLFEIEKNLGHGGSEFIEIAKHKSETIGLVMNDFDSVRVDPIGKIYRDKLVIHPQGVLNSQAATPLIEYVHVDDLPGGSYTMNVCNRWNVLVGSGGIDIKTTGPVNVSGSIVNMAGDQVNISSANEVNIDGGRRLSLEADIVTIKQRDRDQVLVDSNLGVSQNVIIGGGAHVEGELTVNHITAPAEIQETDPVVIFGQLLAGLKFKCHLNGGTHVDAADSSDNHPNWANCTITVIPGPTDEGSNHNKVRMYPHTHHFKNVPLNLKTDNDNVRKDAMDNNAGVRRDAKPVEAKTWDEKLYDENITNVKSVNHEDQSQNESFRDKSCNDDNWCTPE